MTYIPTENQLGVQPIAQSSSTRNTDLGSIVRARDFVYGSGEFIYLLGCAGTVVGSVVIWDGQSSGTPTYQTALAPATINLGQPLAIAMSANVAGQYGWYQLSGQAVCLTNGTLAANAAVYLAGLGELTSSATPGLRVFDAVSVTGSGVPSSGLAVVEIDRAFAEAFDTSGIRNQRTITGSGDLLITTGDSILDVKVSAPLTITVPAASTRGGAPLRFEDVAGNWATDNITFNRTGSDTFDGLTSLTGQVNYGWLELTPYNDGTGYKIQGDF